MLVEASHVAKRNGLILRILSVLMSPSVQFFWDDSWERGVCGTRILIQVFTQTLVWATIFTKCGRAPGQKRTLGSEWVFRRNALHAGRSLPSSHCCFSVCGWLAVRVCEALRNREMEEEGRIFTMEDVARFRVGYDQPTVDYRRRGSTYSGLPLECGRQKQIARGYLLDVED